MGKIIFILGGARSGKSSYAIKLAKGEAQRSVLFVATAQGLDKEMRLRIQTHKKNRPPHWKTMEEPKNLVLRLKKLPKKFDLIIIDCLTLFISNLLQEGFKAKEIEKEFKALLKILKEAKFQSILISNEAGLGIVPDNSLARTFRDIAGSINQLVAKEADEVKFIISGLPVSLKNTPRLIMHPALI